MQVKVRFFSSLSSLIGARELELNLPEGARVADLAQALQRKFPEQASVLARVVLLVEQKSASAETELEDGAQVLALMVLSGGGKQF